MTERKVFCTENFVYKKYRFILIINLNRAVYTPIWVYIIVQLNLGQSMFFKFSNNILFRHG